MPRVKLVPTTEAATRDTLARVARDRGDAYAIYRAMANSPFVLEGLVQLIVDFTTRSTLTERLREMLILRIAGLTRCDYVWARHRGRADTAGISKDLRRQLSEGPVAAGFTDAERAALAAVDCLTTGASCPDDVLDEVHRFFSDEQVVEILALAGLYGLIAKMALNLRLELEPGDTGLDAG